MNVQIRHSGNLLEVAPATVEPLLEKTLTYWYRNMNQDPRKKDVGKMKFTKKRVYRVDADRLLCLQGLLPRILDELKKQGCVVEYTDLREPHLLYPDQANLERFIPDPGMRIGQDDIIKIINDYDFGQIDAPTGYGKTELIVMLAAYFPRNNIIVCSPTASLLKDTYPRLLAVTPNVSRIGGGFKENPSQIVLTTDKSLQRVPVDNYQILLADEVHRFASAEAAKIIAQVRHTKMFGFSATTRKRGDGADLRTEALFGPVRYSMTYQQAEALGYTSPVKYYMGDISERDCRIDSSRWDLPAWRKRNCYWTNTLRSRRLMEDATRIPVAAGLGPDCQTMVAVETLKHAFALKQWDPSYQVVYAERDRKEWDAMQEAGTVPSDEVFIDRKMREQLRKNFSNGKLRKVICTPTWSTGMNFVHLTVIVNAAGATSEILNIQWGGRGSRVRADKPFTLIVDSADQWDKWTRRRSNARRRIYESKGWKELTLGQASAYRQEAML